MVYSYTGKSHVRLLRNSALFLIPIRLAIQSGFIQSGKSRVLRAVMKSQEILLKFEESQKKAWKFYQSKEFCGTQLWSYINVQISFVKFKTQTCSLNVTTQYAIPKCHFIE